MPENIVTSDYLINFWKIDLRTLKKYSDIRYENNPLPKTGRNIFDFVVAVRWMYEKQLNKIGRLEKHNITRKQVSDLLGYKNEKYINELEKSFGLPKEDYNQYNIFKVIKWFVNYKEEIHLKELNKIKEEKPQDDLARKSARLKELEILEREGKLVELDMIKWAWVEEYKLLDEILSGIGPKLSPKLLKKENISEIRLLIDAEIKKAKDKISQLPLKELK